MLGFINKLYHKKISSKGLGVFRICFAFILFLEVNRIFRYKELYYDPMPFINSIDFNYSLLLIFWQCCLLCLFLGFFTRLFAVVNYLICFFLINDFGAYEYHMDYVYLGVCFVLIFIPSENSYSIDAIFKSKLGLKKQMNRTNVLSYYSVIFIGIALVYFGSIFFKLRSQAWLSGLGIWLPCSLPQVTITNNQWILNQEYLIKIIGFTALVFEIVFPFTFFIKKWRIYLCLIGVIMHLGIAYVFPIPYFAFGYVAMYLLLIPVGFWSKIEIKVKSIIDKKRISFNFDSFFLNSLYSFYFRYSGIRLSDFLSKKLLKVVFVTVCVLQFNAAVNVASKKLDKELKNYFVESKEFTKALEFRKALELKVKCIRTFSQEFLGITGHGVFVDAHYIGFDKIFTLKYKERYLPLYDAQGMPGEYLKSGIWANYNFRVNKPFVLNGEHAEEKLNIGLSRYASFWAKKNEIDLNKAHFEVLMKPIKASFTWREDLLEENLSLPWKKVGDMTWDNNKSTIIFNDLNN